MLAILGLVAVGFALAALVDSDSGDADIRISGEPEGFSDDENAILDQVYRPDVEANLLDLVNEGELSQDLADAALDAIDFRTGAQNIDTAGGDDTVALGEGNDIVKAGAGDDLVLGGAGDDEIDLGLGNDVSGVDTRTIDGDDDFLGFPEADLGNGAGAGVAEAFLEGGDDRIFGGPGDDAISDSFGSNFVNGQQGDDFIVTVDHPSDGVTPDRVKGGFGFDTLIVDQGDSVETGRGFDLVTVDVFGGVEDGYQVVTIDDFEKGKDTLELEGGTGLLLTPEPSGPGDVVENPITVTPLADGTGSMVLINGIPVVRVLGPVDLGVEDILLST